MKILIQKYSLFIQQNQTNKTYYIPALHQYLVLVIFSHHLIPYCENEDKSTNSDDNAFCKMGMWISFSCHWKFRLHFQLKDCFAPKFYLVYKIHIVGQPEKNSVKNPTRALTEALIPLNKTIWRNVLETNVQLFIKWNCIKWTKAWR